MGKIILLFGLLFLLFRAGGTTSQSNLNTLTVAVQKIHKGPRPRSIDIVPKCDYDSMANSLTVFMDESGPFTVTITNNTTGERWVEIGDAGYCNVYISGEHGDYTLYIDTASGDSYSGNFTL